MSTITSEETAIADEAVLDKAESQVSARAGVRYYFLDNLRALAMLAGIIFHAAISYGVIFHDIWPMADKSTSIVIDFFCWTLHTFRMPLFFLISGFFAHYLVKKYGLSGFIKNRAKRILLPFIIFWPLISASIIGILYYAAFYMPVDTPLVNLIELAFTNPEAMNGQKPPVSTTHLWFLYYLSIFCFVTVIAYRLLPSMPKAYRLLCSPVTLFVFLPVITGAGLIKQFMPHPAPESFIPTYWALQFFGSFFAVGWVIFAKPEMLDRLQKFVPLLAVTSTVFSAIFFYSLPESLTFAAMLTLLETGPTINLKHVVAVFSCAILAWHLSFMCLLLAKRFLNSQNSVMRYISDASYWAYILHIPLLFYIQAYFHTLSLPIIVELSATITITLSLCFISYALLVKHTPIGWLLHGRKKRIH